MSEPLTLLQMLECDLTRDQCIRFICGARKSLNASEEEFTTKRVIIAQQVEVLYHTIGVAARNAAFNASPYSSTTTKSTPKPIKQKFVWADFKSIIDAFLDTEIEDELSFSYKEACDYVEASWLEEGKYEWHPEDSALNANGVLRWKNNVASLLQDNPATTYSKRRKCWVIL